MDPRNEPNLKPPVDETRRRLAKAGLAAPAVLGVLASRPVLAGNKYHHCTPSGHISGFASPPADNALKCSTLGEKPSYYALSKSNWPGDNGGPFLDNQGKPRNFKDAPASQGTFHGLNVLFADAYKFTQGNKVPTVWDVLKNCNTNDNNGNCTGNATLEAKPGFNPDIELGQEAIAAAMNALKYHDFPISIQQVVEMFNKVVVSGGLYQVTSTNQWNAAEVKAYLKSLHA